jgi:hypothetical protein
MKETTYRCDVCGSVIPTGLVSYELETNDGRNREYTQVRDLEGIAQQIITSYTIRREDKSEIPVGLVCLKKNFLVCSDCAINQLLDRIEHSYLKKWLNKKGEMYGR